MFGASLTVAGKHAGDYDGYVPDFFPGQHYGDYVKLDIDIDTGKIVNWKTPADDELSIFKKEEA
jgi:hypothetical protein